MKKSILTSALLLIGSFIFAQDGTRKPISDPTVNGQTIDLTTGMEITSSGANASTSPSPNYHPVTYAANEYYTVVLHSANHTKLKFSFRTISQLAPDVSHVPIEHVDIKSTDHLKVYEGIGTGGTVLFDYTDLSYTTTASYPALNGSAVVSMGEYITIEWTSASASAGYGFRVAVGCPPDNCNGNKPAADSCQNATPICDLTNYCGNTSYWYSRDLPGTTGAMCDGNFSYPTTCALFNGAVDNNSWLIFQAASSAVNLQVTVSNCTNSTNNGIQFAVYNGSNCNNFTLVSDAVYISPTGIPPPGTTVSLTGLTPGNNYYIMIDGRNGDVCDYTIKASSGVSVISANSTNNNICLGTSTTLCASGGNNFTWSNGGGLGSCVTISPTITTTYTVTGVPDFQLCGLLGTASVVVTINTPPAVLATGNSICSGACTTVTATGGLTYTWSTSPVQYGSAITVCPTATTTYYVTGTNSSGCTNTSSTVVTVNTFTAFGATGNSVCNGGCTTVTATGGSFYTWNTSPPQTSSTITVCPSATTTYIVTITNSLGCSATTSAVVTVNLFTTIGATGNVVCSGGCTTISATGGDTYTWSTSPTKTGATITVCPTATITYTVTGANFSGCSGTSSTVVNINTIPNITATGGQACKGICTTISANGPNLFMWSTGQSGNIISVCPTTTTTYTVTGTTANCTNSTSAIVTIFANPTITANGGAICIGNSFVITASGGSLYTWNIGPNTPGITVSPTTITTYCVTGTDSHTCSNTYCVIVNVNQKPGITLNGTPSSICYGNNTILTASGGNSYSWNNGLGTGQPKTVSPTQTIMYIVTGTNNNGCSNTIQTTITVFPQLFASTIPTDEICNNDSGAACITVTGGVPTYSYLWNTGANTSCINNLHTGSFTVSVVDLNGCPIIRTIVVNNIMTDPDGTPTADKYLDVITHKFLFDWNGTNGSNYHWNFGDGDTSNLKNPNHTYEKSGKYTVKLIVMSANGCLMEYTFTVEVVVPFKIEVFNVFTPNNDNINDRYKVKYTGDYLYFRMLIFDRWGRKLHETKDIDAGWKCDNCSDGTYYYIIYAKGKDGSEYDFHGALTLIK
ncbi:MAG: gliding motility-associated C-terminal domain-containing protein [Bacteroidales bacterium]|jgi:gliding motility-associated-like protein